MKNLLIVGIVPAVNRPELRAVDCDEFFAVEAESVAESDKRAENHAESFGIVFAEIGRKFSQKIED